MHGGQALFCFAKTVPDSIKDNTNMKTSHTSRWLALAALIVTFPAYGHAQGKDKKAPEKWSNLYEPHADGKMPYRLMKPLGFDSNQSYPLIVSLHGGV